MGRRELESVIVRNLQPEFEPVAVVWSNTIPNDALQFQKGKFGCVLYLFTEADLAAPRAVLGMMGIDGRKVMRKRTQSRAGYDGHRWPEGHA